MAVNKASMARRQRERARQQQRLEKRQRRTERREQKREGGAEVEIDWGSAVREVELDEDDAEVAAAVDAQVPGNEPE